MSESDGIKHRVAVRDALAARIRGFTGAAVAVSALLSGLFAGIAAASAPGHKLSGTAARPQSPSARKVTKSVRPSAVIPPLPAPPGPGNVGGAAPSAPTPAAAPSATQTPPVVVSGGS